MPAPFKQLYAFGSFVLDLESHRLMRDGQTVPLSPKSLDALRVLLEQPGRVVGRAELMRAVWAEAFVEDANLTVAVSQLRKALAQDGETFEYIETVPRVGYRFIGEVREISEVGVRQPVVLAKHTFSRTVIEEEDTSTEPSDLNDSTATRQPFASLVTANWRTVLATTAAVVTVLVVLGGIWSQLKERSARGAHLPVKSLAVLPFNSLGSNDDEHMGLGIADVLITRLSNVRELNVRPTSAIMIFDGSSEESITAGRKLNVDAVLEGSIHHLNGRVRVTARLLRVDDQMPLWAGQFDRPLRDELQLQDEIALQLVEALALPLSGSERNAVTKRYTESADAYQLYLKGRYHWNKRTYAGMIEAERLFRNAIESDPNFALAFVGLADTLATRSAEQDAYNAVQRALEIDPKLAEAHATLGFVKMFKEWKWPDSRRAFTEAIELNPGYATAHQWYATLLAIEGRNDEAKIELHRALEINPTSHNLLADMGQLHYFAGEYEQAKEYCEKALAVYPDFAFAHQYLFYIYLKMGNHDKAVDALVRADTISSAIDNPSVGTKQRVETVFKETRELYQKGGIKGYIKQRLAAEKQDASGYYSSAMYYAYLSEKERALDNLEKACHSRSFLVVFAKADPMFEGLRGEPRYQAILKKMGL